MLSAVLLTRGSSGRDLLVLSFKIRLDFVLVSDMALLVCSPRFEKDGLIAKEFSKNRDNGDDDEWVGSMVMSCGWVKKGRKKFMVNKA